mgnify:CR=1 FL=1
MLHVMHGHEHVYSDLYMSCVTLTFEVWIRVKVTAHRINEDNICTKLDGNPSMHML